MIEDLTEKNVNSYIIMSYENSQCYDFEEFQDDIKKIKYIKRLFNRYFKTGDLKDRLILNHIISFYNVFSSEAATRILFYKLEEDAYPILKTFLTYLNLMPPVVEMINGKNILDSDIEIIHDITNILRNR